MEGFVTHQRLYSTRTHKGRKPLLTYKIPIYQSQESSLPPTLEQQQQSRDKRKSSPPISDSFSCFSILNLKVWNGYLHETSSGWGRYLLISVNFFHPFLISFPRQPIWKLRELNKKKWPQLCQQVDVCRGFEHSPRRHTNGGGEYLTLKKAPRCFVSQVVF